MTIRTIQPPDNAAIAKIIRDVLTEFGAAHPGTVYFDKTTDSLFELFQKPTSVYYIVEDENQILGGGGIYPTTGLPADTCELVKMYLIPQARGKGLGKMLIEKCLRSAQAQGFKNVYLETMPELKDALKVYEKYGFKYLKQALGNSGHFGCGLWMIKKL